MQVRFSEQVGVRKISSADLASNGLAGTEDLVWDASNNYEIEVPDATGAFLVASDPRFIASNPSAKTKAKTVSSTPPEAVSTPTPVSEVMTEGPTPEPIKFEAGAPATPGL